MTAERCVTHEGREIGSVWLAGFNWSGTSSTEWWRARTTHGEQTETTSYEAATAWLIQQDAKRKDAA